MEPFTAAMELMPRRYAGKMERFATLHPEEIRLRIGRAPALYYSGAEHPLDAETVEGKDIVCILERATGASLYHAADSMRRGYYCVGSLRLGVCGQASMQERGTGFSSYSSLCIRISREIRGVCRALSGQICAETFVNTLIISPPGGGKTTALRDLIRTLADRGTRVGVIDERGELSLHYYDLGRCSDVISGTDKLAGAILLLRSMTPEIIAADEISTQSDIDAMFEINGCGTGILATAHARDLSDLQCREGYRALLECGVFRRVLVIRCARGVRSYELKELLL